MIFPFLLKEPMLLSKPGGTVRGKGMFLLKKRAILRWFFMRGVLGRFVKTRICRLAIPFVGLWIEKTGMLSLEHLRLGPNAPVFLFHLAPTGNNLLASVDSHLCEEDASLAQVVWDRHSIRLSWRVIGPLKNEEMQYHYF